MSNPAPAKYQIVTESRRHFAECFNKLKAKGFSYSGQRLKTTEEIFHEFGYYEIITIGTNSECRMILGGRQWLRDNTPTITVDEFLKDKFQAYYDA